MKNLISTQEWLPISKVLEKGVVKLKDESYIKIVNIVPINYNLKSDLEKEAILNSYKTFLKTCNFNIQILIQSNQEDLNLIISKIQNQVKKEKNQKIKEISQQYISYIKELNYQRKFTAKKFFIIIEVKNNKEESQKIQELEERVFKIKETLSRCGNRVEEYNKREEIKEVLFSFFNRRISQNKKEENKGDLSYGQSPRVG